MAINLNKKVYKVFDSEGNYLRTFPSYQQAMTFVQSRGGIGRWRIM